MKLPGISTSIKINLKQLSQLQSFLSFPAFVWELLMILKILSIMYVLLLQLLVVSILQASSSCQNKKKQNQPTKKEKFIYCLWENIANIFWRPNFIIHIFEYFYAVLNAPGY